MPSKPITGRSGTAWTRPGRCDAQFRVEKKHLNGMRNVHGGCFMAFADYCLFAMASAHLQGPGVTVAFACEFLDAAREGELVECDGEMTRAGGSLIFLRGTLLRASASCSPSPAPSSG